MVTFRGQKECHYKLNSKILHREDGPAVICRNLEGDIIEEIWYNNGIIHRENGPAHIKYFLYELNNKKYNFTKSVLFMKNGELHREDGPAVIEFYELFNHKTNTFNIKREQWYKNGLLHNEHGPADIIYNFSKLQNNLVEQYSYYSNGVINRFDGPAIIYHNLQKGQWVINGIIMTDIISYNNVKVSNTKKENIPLFNNKQCVNLDILKFIKCKNNLLNVYLFDREYGKFVDKYIKCDI